MAGLIQENDWIRLKNLTEEKLPKDYSLRLSKEFDLTRGRITQIRNIIRDNDYSPEKISMTNLMVFKRLKDLCLDKREEKELLQNLSF